MKAAAQPARGREDVAHQVYRNVEHPWSREPGWDLMLIQSEAEGLLAACERQGWQLWCIGESLRGSTRAVLIKPNGLAPGKNAVDWIDPRPWPESTV